MVPEYGATVPPPAPVTIYRTPATISAIATTATGSMRSFVCERQKDRGMGPQWMLALGIGASAALLVAMAPRDPRGCYETTAPMGLRRVAVASDGSCLYHAVGCALASAGIAVDGWAPGRPPAWGGNLRWVLSQYVRRLRGTGAVDLEGLIRGRYEPTDSVDALLARIERRCESPTCEWGQYGEIALLARLAGVAIAVHVTYECRTPRWVVVAGPDGRETEVPQPELARRGNVVHILNLDGRHFDALLPV